MLFRSADLITPDQKAYLSDYLARFIAMMSGPDFASAERGYPKWLHVDSWVDHALVRELARDIDSYRLSTYLYKDADPDGGKFHAGPVWDFDRGFGNAGYYDAANPEGWSWLDGKRPTKLLENPPPFWKRLLESPDFRAQMACRWVQLRRGPWKTVAMTAHVNEWLTLTGRAVARDQARWKTINAPLDNASPPRGSSYDAEVAWFLSWLGRRALWLDATLEPLCPR